jgi:NitT/TauT family transport system ATP-binding protein
MPVAATLRPPGEALARQEQDASAPYFVRIDEKSFVHAAGGAIPVIRGLSFELAPNSFTCLIGPSGCGKTTTLRIMLGLDSDFVGAVSPRLREARIAPVFQEPRLLPWRTVEQNIRLALPAAIADKDLTPILSAVELEPFRHSYPAELSLGMARRVALARAFSVEPDVLLLDEPFVSLDEATADRLRSLLLDLWRSTRVTVLMVTHNVREAVRLADRLIVLSPRPAHVTGSLDVPLARAERHGPALDAILAKLAARFPTLAFL